MNRKIAKTVSSDIVQLGYCIVNKQLTRDVEKFTSSVKPAGEKHTTDVIQLSDDIQGLSELIIVVIGLRKEVNDLRDLVAVVQAENEELKMSINPSATAAGSPPVTSDSSNPISVTDKDSDDAVQPSKAEVPSTSAKSTSCDILSIKVPNALLSQKRGSSSDLESSSESDSSSESQLPPMTLVESRKKKLKNKRHPRAPKKVIKAASTSDKNLPAPKTDSAASVKEVYIGNVDPSILTSDIVSHLQSHDIQVKKNDVRTLAKGDDYHSFCVKIPIVNSKKVLETGTKSIWPKGLKVRPFTQKNATHVQKRAVKPVSSHKRPKFPTNRSIPANYDNYWQRTASYSSPRDGQRISYSRTSEWPPLPSHPTRHSYADRENGWFSRYHNHDYENDFYCDDRYC